MQDEDENEQVEIFRPSLAGQLIDPALLLAASCLGASAAAPYVGPWIVDWMRIMVAPICIGVAIKAAWTTAATRLEIHPDKIVLVKGLLGRAAATVWASEIIGLDIEQSLAGRLMSYGNLAIETRGTDIVRIECLATPQEVHRTIEEVRAGMAAFIEPALPASTP